MKAFLDFFGGSKSFLLYGIRKDNTIACASLSVDSTTEPSILALIRFIFSLWWALGWRSAKVLETIHKEEPKYKEPYLELIIIGTLPKYQKQGLGRTMLHFLYEQTKRKGYKGVILVANHDTPAFQLYSKEGFVIDKEFSCREVTLCWMRLVI